MNKKNLITDKDIFIKNTKDFFDTLFGSALKQECGEIEIRTFNPGQSLFGRSTIKAAELAYKICNNGIDAYFGVNPRVNRGGKKENVRYLAALHAEVDYGSDGHKKDSIYKTYDDALKAIQGFNPQPTIVVHSGGGFHCYWVLENPILVTDYGVDQLESINKNISIRIGGDLGTQDISRVLRVAGTYNFKLPDNLREVKLVCNTGKRYSYEDFQEFLNSEAPPAKPEKKNKEINIISEVKGVMDVNSLPVSERIKKLIVNGNDGSYKSRSETDMAVITALIHKGITEAEIKNIFQSHKVGEKYRKQGDSYLKHTIESARKKSNLSEEEMADPLFVSGSLHKDDKGYHLDILKFQEHMVGKFKIKIIEDSFFKYNGICYEACKEETLNHMCQQELSKHRGRFTKSAFRDFLHYAVGQVLVDNNKAYQDRVGYLTLKNGLFSLNEEKLIEHSPDIFTTNLLPYEYDPTAQCPRFMKYLEEVFMNNGEMLLFVQEAVGYGFHKSIPVAAIFFLIGEGSNGKSVFINIMTCLYGEENTCSISFNALSNEYYILNLFGKMINISSETPQKKQINTDMIKAVVAGDPVTGRGPYKLPKTFKPYAKHYLAMNEFPDFNDSSHGMWRRIYPINFPRTFSEQEMDVELTDKLKGELPGILNWALEGYKRLRAQNFRFTEVKSMKVSKQKYRNESNNVLMFAAERLIKSNPDERIKFGETYEIYKSYCGSESLGNPFNKNQFKNILAGAGYKIDKSTKHSNQVHIFGVKLI